MYGAFVGPMPVRQFLDDFLPVAPSPRPAGNIKFRSSSKTFEKHFVDAVNTSPFCPSLHFVNTKNKGDTNYRNIRKPDISACTRSLDAEACDRVEWPDLELHLEVKTEKEDPFVDPSQGSDNRSCEFEHDSGVADKARGQIISYAQAQQSSQFRIFTFSVCLIGTNMARLIRWDRTGAVVSERFHWRGRSTTLVEFLWRFEHLSPEERGHDTNVTEASDDEVGLALPVLEASNHWPDGVPLPLHKILIHDDETGRDHEFITPSAVSASTALTGRASAGYIAYDLATGACVYLKDTWRIDMDGMEKEGSIYRRLHLHNVPHIAHLVCAGDVGAQKTRTQDYVDAPWACWTQGIIPHRHYRLALDTIGRALETFNSTHQLCKAMCDVLEAHWIAFSEAKVLHRDISIGNVLLTMEGDKGLLIDWDLCKIVENEQAPRQEWRTGTWQFLSAALLANPTDKRHELCDDLESALWVVTYILCKFRPSLFSKLSKHLFHIFDEAETTDGVTVGGEGKTFFLKNEYLKASQMRLSYPAPCAELIEDLRNLFRPMYYDADDNKADEVAATQTLLRTSLKVLEIFRTRLAEDGWPIDDGSVEVVLQPYSPTSGKRPRDATAVAGRTSSAKRRKSAAVPQRPGKRMPPHSERQ
ncbi:hypothetical protein BV25DRAFT_1849414 [Artomyces pyxidatus]|uniref:Uncharacterized protein n=1 Tax=Artomyces pyxidatus TaxID=48021 RepID=A0ACB8TED9_9AGAM|nr:hypothetical protein BV25DRAFT_1849414 [Artomyces pyxidatus]